MFEKATMQHKYRKPIPLLTLAILLGLGCRKADQIIPNPDTVRTSKAETQHRAKIADSYVAQSWYNLMMKLISETPGHTPPIVARSFGYTGVAIYESLVAEMPHYHSLVGQLQGLTSIPRRKYGNSYVSTIIANAALGQIIKSLFKNVSVSNLNRIDSLQSANEKFYSDQFGENLIHRSREYGRAVADAVFEWSLSDGGHEAYLKLFPSNYIAPEGVDKWIPTPTLYQNAMLPDWGDNRPMLPSNSPGAIDPDAPPTFSTSPGSEFYAAAYEVYNTSRHLSSSQATIALYWADGDETFTPAGHNLAITLQMIRNRNLNLLEAAILLAKVGIAENDAGIICWRSKFKTNLLRPVTYIRRYIDALWLPLISTPPFPTYTSGHSTFTSAAAAILNVEFGDQTPFTDSSKIAYGFSPRSFRNFNEAAQEAAISRLYGGIHYAFDNVNGFVCGQKIAINVEQLRW